MPTIDEVYLKQESLNPILEDGLETLSRDQTVSFTRYTRLVLPIDGYVFWVRADLVAPGALIGGMSMDEAASSEPSTIATASATIEARGSLHFFSENVQEEDTTYWINRVVFTSQVPLHPGFSAVEDNEVYIGRFSSPVDSTKTIAFAFQRQDGFYSEANIWHYKGDAIYPFMESQIVDSLVGLSTRQIVSNSLPLWLVLNNYTPFYGFGNHIQLFPSSLVPSNLRPPFGSVHIEPSSTVAVASAPYLDATSSRAQLCTDSVRVCLYGLRNDEAMNFLDCVFQYSTDYNTIGMMNCPVIRDEKRQQNELGIVAMKKSVDFDVCYSQGVSRNIGRQIMCRSIIGYATRGPFG